MLDLTGDATGDVEFGAYGDAGLTDLAVVFDKSGVDGGAGRADFCAKSVGQVEKRGGNSPCFPRRSLRPR